MTATVIIYIMVALVGLRLLLLVARLAHFAAGLILLFLIGSTLIGSAGVAHQVANLLHLQTQIRDVIMHANNPEAGSPSLAEQRLTKMIDHLAMSIGVSADSVHVAQVCNNGHQTIDVGYQEPVFPLGLGRQQHIHSVVSDKGQCDVIRQTPATLRQIRRQVQDLPATAQQVQAGLSRLHFHVTVSH